MTSNCSKRAICYNYMERILTPCPAYLCSLKYLHYYVNLHIKYISFGTNVYFISGFYCIVKIRWSSDRIYGQISSERTAELLELSISKFLLNTKITGPARLLPRLRRPPHAHIGGEAHIQVSMYGVLESRKG